MRGFLGAASQTFLRNGERVRVGSAILWMRAPDVYDAVSIATAGGSPVWNNDILMTLGPIRTPFGFHSTAKDVIRGVDLSGKRVIITGASSGIGIETAEALAEARAEITLAVRNPQAGEEVAARLRTSTGNPEIHVRRLNLADLHSVRAFASAWSGPLHILVNNAGIMANPELERTPQGFEIQFATNFLGHFLLTTGLRHALVAGNRARVVSVSSSANTYAPVLFDDPHFRFMPYSPFVAYGQSKTANILFAVELTRRWAGNGIEARVVMSRPTDFSGGVAPYALDPGNAAPLWTLAEQLAAE
jgi:NAD(P)-dependent dehydrogenase (short-subunit alcohol dehydrogenase family)